MGILTVGEAISYLRDLCTYPGVSGYFIKSVDLIEQEIATLRAENSRLRPFEKSFKEEVSRLADLRYKGRLDAAERQLQAVRDIVLREDY